MCRSESALRNLSALLQLGNNAEVRNYISVLTATLNRLSTDDGRNAQALRHTRSTLICTMCRLESGEQVGKMTAKDKNLFHSSYLTCDIILQESAEDSVCILRSLLKVTNQVGV